MTEDERRERRLAAYTRYNTSRKGKARYARYEAKHPERKENRWEPSRNALRSAEGMS
jgi:hypothetical protein